MTSSNANFIRILALLCTIGVTISSTGAYVPCDEKGQCKFGGRCWPDGMCHCVFKCSPSMWDSTRPQWHCAPKDIQRRPFRNLCELTAASCELQMPIPIIKVDFKKSRNQRCNAKRESSWKLCDKPSDFMGTCGGNLALDGNLNAGICLRERYSNTTRCECPATMDGYDCQSRAIPLVQMQKKSYDKAVLKTSEFSVSNVAVQLIYSISAIFVASVIVILVVKWYKNGTLGFSKKKTLKNTTSHEELNMNNNNNNRTDDVTIGIYIEKENSEIAQISYNNNNSHCSKDNKCETVDNNCCTSKNSLEIIVTEPSPVLETKQFH